MSLQLLSASSFSASLAWFGGFCVLFLGLSCTVLHPMSVVWVPLLLGLYHLRKKIGVLFNQGMVFPGLVVALGLMEERLGRAFLIPLLSLPGFSRANTARGKGGSKGQTEARPRIPHPTALSAR